MHCELFPWAWYAIVPENLYRLPCSRKPEGHPGTMIRPVQILPGPRIQNVQFFWMVSSCSRIRLWSQCVQTYYSHECFGCKRQKPSTNRKGKLLALFTEKLQWPNAPASSMAVSGCSDDVVISLSCPTRTYFLCIYFLFITLSHSDKDGISTSRLSFLLCQ